ncbi:hypothetical protein D3C81_376470 [compost metagenome]
MYGYNQCNPFAEPNLVENTGVLSQQWIIWYQSRTMVSIDEAVKVGVIKMLEVQQRMVGFQREYIINTASVLAGYSAGGAFMQGPYGPQFSNGHRGHTRADIDNAIMSVFRNSGRYVPYVDEPSPFYEDRKEIDGGYMGDIHPWDGWYASSDERTLEDAKIRRPDLIEELNSQPRGRSDLMMLASPLRTPTGHLSLLWVMAEAERHHDKTLGEIHNEGHVLLQRGGGTYTGGFRPDMRNPGGAL